MNRRDLIRRGAAGFAVATLAPATLLQVACGSTEQIARWVVTVISTLRDVRPILVELGQAGIGIVAIVDRAVPVLESLKKAFQDNEHASALTFLDNLINPQNGIIVELSNAIGILQGPQRQILLGLMAIAGVALHLIAANIGQNVSPADATRARESRPDAVASVEKAANSKALENAFAASRF